MSNLKNNPLRKEKQVIFMRHRDREWREWDKRKTGNGITMGKINHLDYILHPNNIP